MTDWSCPECGQRFVQRNASHSCAVQDVAAFFEPWPGGLAIYRAVHEAIAALGPVEVAASKTQVSFRARTRFAWLWVPAQALKHGPPDIYLTFDLPLRLASARVKEVVEPRPGHFSHHVRLADAAAVDGEVRGWLRSAYKAASNSAGGRHLR